MGKVERPLIKGKSPEELITFIRQQLEKREPFYTKAKYTLDVSLMDNYEKIKISVDKIKELLDL
jgi:shikimate kinase